MSRVSAEFWLRRTCQAAWLRRWAAVLVSSALILYACSVVVLQQAQHMYPAMVPPVLEDRRPKWIALDTFFPSDRLPLRDLVGHGWYGVEPGLGRWSAGLSSTLVLPQQARNLDLDLHLVIMAAADGRHASNSTTVSLNNQPLGVLEVATDEESDYIVRIPASVHRGYPMLIVLAYSFAVDPEGPDDRSIALRLGGIRLEAAQ